MWQKIKTKIANYLLRHLFRLPIEEDVVRIKKDTLNKTSYIILGKEKLTEEDSRRLGSEARMIRQLDAYKMLIRDMQTFCAEQSINKSTNEYDLLWGKSGLYHLKYLDEKLEKIGEI